MRNVSRTWRVSYTRMQGITLIELLIVVVIVGILASIAYPSYQNQVRKTRLADGKAALMQKAQQLERCYTRFSAYNSANCTVVLPEASEEGYYTISAAVATTASAFSLNATPQGDQANDSRCGVLRLTSAGQEGSLGLNTDANNCW